MKDVPRCPRGQFRAEVEQLRARGRLQHTKLDGQTTPVFDARRHGRNARDERHGPALAGRSVAGLIRKTRWPLGWIGFRNGLHVVACDRFVQRPKAVAATGPRFGGREPTPGKRKKRCCEKKRTPAAAGPHRKLPDPSCWHPREGCCWWTTFSNREGFGKNVNLIQPTILKLRSQPDFRNFGKRDV
jgi:hypothetical protein